MNIFLRVFMNEATSRIYPERPSLQQDWSHFHSWHRFKSDAEVVKCNMWRKRGVNKSTTCLFFFHVKSFKK